MWRLPRSAPRLPQPPRKTAPRRDQRRDRKILIGVFYDNVVANNTLDGPFDQMPDNFIEGDKFQQAILAVAPNRNGQINRYGSFVDGARFMVAPYMEYRSPKDLAIFDRCAISRRIPAECMTHASRLRRKAAMAQTRGRWPCSIAPADMCAAECRRQA